jgi:Flp pilus assembly protein CpaB
MPSMESLFPTGAHLLRRLSGRPRRIAAGACAALAVLLAVSGTGRGGAERSEPVAVAARDVPAGTALSEADVRVAAWPHSAVPAGALHAGADAVGRRVGAAMGAGEPITGRRLADGYGDALAPGAVAVIISVDTQALLAHAGDRVDVYASDARSPDTAAPASGSSAAIAPTTGSSAAEDPSDSGPVARLIAAGAGVLAALPATARGDDGQLVLEVDRSSIPAVAAARGTRLTVVVTAPP